MGIAPYSVCEGDAIHWLGQVEASSVHLVFADPPFNIGYDYDVYDDSRPPNEYLSWSRQWMTGVFRALQPDGTFWLAIGDEYAAELKVLAQQIGFVCRSWVIWYYTFGVNCKKGFSRSHTHLFHFVKNPNAFTFNAENPAIRIRSARQLVYADGRANPNGRLPDNTWIYRPQDLPGGFAATHDTWYFPRVAGTFREREGFHGCQMPEQLLGRIVRVSSNPGDVVLDPFSGSGTTLAVAKKLGRQWIGIELSTEYALRIKRRLDVAQVGDPLDGVENPLTSVPNTRNGKKKDGVRRPKRHRPLRPTLSPKREPEAAAGVIAAYLEVNGGFSTDRVLAAPELNHAFLDACQRRGVPGEPVTWNRLLLKVRKAGKLPRYKGTSKRTLTFQEMDSYSFASEIAMQSMIADSGLALDEILCDPNLAVAFDKTAAIFAPDRTSFEYRWAALAIRKRARSAKKLATTKYSDWLQKTLPPATPLARCDLTRYKASGVYLLIGHEEQPLYVGETFCLRDRIEQISASDAWRSLGLSSVRFLPAGEGRHGLQSILIRRLNPLLNCRLLAPELLKAAT